MTNTRRSFIKKTCMAGACLCGFGSVLSGEEKTYSENTGVNPKEDMFKNWISEVLSNMDGKLDEEELRDLIKSASKAHYQYLNMNNLLNSYTGKLDEFIKFIEKEWNWKFHYEEDNKVLIADENKSVCVCPLLNAAKGKRLPALCYCSEGFAEMMFSKVNQAPVKAIVTSSIQRGDDRCIYRILL